MKTSQFLAKALKSFNGGKSYSRNPQLRCWYKRCTTPTSCIASNMTMQSKNRNLTGQLEFLDKKLGVKIANKAKASIAVSLGHTNLDGFQKNGFKKVEAVLKAAIKRERANGN